MTSIGHRAAAEPHHGPSRSRRHQACEKKARVRNGAGAFCLEPPSRAFRQSVPVCFFKAKKGRWLRPGESNPVTGDGKLEDGKYKEIWTVRKLP